jgi:hypothetical protein
MVTKRINWVVWDSASRMYLQHDGSFGVDKSAQLFANPVAALSSCRKDDHKAVEVEVSLRHLRTATVTVEDI